MTVRAAAPAGLALAVLLLTAASGGTANADEARWTIAPSAGPAAGDGRPCVYAEGAPGTVLEDTVTVTNPTREPLDVTLRGADADKAGEGGKGGQSGEVGAGGKGGQSGEAEKDDKAETAEDTSAWITFADRTVRVPARTRADIPFTVSVPRDATPGDHPGAVVARADGRESAVAVRLRVSGPTLSALTVEHVHVVRGGGAGGGTSIAYEVVNRGNTTLHPRLTVKADGVLGTVLDKRPRALPVDVPPGRRVRLTEPWPHAPALDAVDVKVTVTAGGGAADSATVDARFVPWGAVGGALAALAATGCVTAWYVRRRRRPAET
ncbi:COG1470 family protein [Streptomyces beihaiensis]|uniref:DUF916 domain-containing protein n=1 Tax=Streptomyces beihaiensis TaxID=2984495 RepID=A0ABT3U4B2_9ACTN|nr:hypothetical protein [Streptomyces beihaiensis]MCX3063402.1 hypothetical protein [Streptomyces beihaiensis]